MANKYWIDLETLTMVAKSPEEATKKAIRYLKKNMPEIVNVEEYDN